MNIAIFGATSYLARDLILSFSRKSDANLFLFGRNASLIQTWLQAQSLAKRYQGLDYADFHSDAPYDAIINFVGIGDPAKAIGLGASLFEITRHFDTLALDYLQKNPTTAYVFLSSGAVYGNSFHQAAHADTQATFDINHISSSDYYGLAKLHAEANHRRFANLHITDLRVFNYFSSTTDLTTRFFISDLLRTIREGSTFQTTTNNMFRDYLHPDDLYQLIMCTLSSKRINQPLDCYTKAPIDKLTLLEEMKNHFGLKYTFATSALANGVNATGLKDHYYSLNTRAKSIGYTPTRSSLDCVLQEANVILSSNQSMMHEN